MGQQIVHCESAEELGRRSRLRCNEDAIHVLKENTGTDAVKGIVLHLPLQKNEQLNVQAFSKMKKLKILEIRTDDYGNDISYARSKTSNLEWHGDPSNFMLSNELCVMKMSKYPFESLSINFQPDNLVELIMPHNCIKQLWDGRKSFDKLKHINLSDSQNLIETPYMSEIPNLERLELEHCTSLSKVHPSIEILIQLKWLNLRDCKSLERLADEIRLESLKYLNLSGCSRLNKFPYFVGNMTSLHKLYLDGTAIKELPLSFKSLLSLVSLNRSDCSRLEKIPKDLISDFSNCNLLDEAIPNDLCCLSSLEFLDLSGNKFTRIPDIWQLYKLRMLDLSHCNLLDGAIPNDLCCLSSLAFLNLSRNKFTRIPDIWQLSKLRVLDLSHFNLYCNLLDGAIPNDLSGISSLLSLNLSGNNFTRIPDSVAQLSHLLELNLEDCSWLQVLPKLPLRLEYLYIKACPLLKMFYDQMDVSTSNEILRSTNCSFAAADIDFDGEPNKILYLHPQSLLWIDQSNHYFQSFFTEVACGPALLGSRIPEWINDKSTNSSGTIQMHTDLGLDEWKGLSLVAALSRDFPDLVGRDSSSLVTVTAYG
ncbi:disease resistance-like protein DSC1 [Alnus glutinosa]|uniref:disease resistance-like protein DSC1 n=1 Tax=Alnus glutinosa TaxID=3517 RepID=UPI002D782071|nr:disease resistance-like protein DSC1 [Alnus glutinosa]